MAMGVGAVTSGAGKGTGAISRGAPGNDGSAATASEAAAAFGVRLRGMTGDDALDGGLTGEAATAGASYPGPVCGGGAWMTEGFGLAVVGTTRAAGLRSRA